MAIIYVCHIISLSWSHLNTANFLINPNFTAENTHIIVKDRQLCLYSVQSMQRWQKCTIILIAQHTHIAYLYFYRLLNRFVCMGGGCNQNRVSNARKNAAIWIRFITGLIEVPRCVYLWCLNNINIWICTFAHVCATGFLLVWHFIIIHTHRNPSKNQLSGAHAALMRSQKMPPQFSWRKTQSTAHLQCNCVMCGGWWHNLQKNRARRFPPDTTQQNSAVRFQRGFPT